MVLIKQGRRIPIFLLFMFLFGAVMAAQNLQSTYSIWNLLALILFTMAFVRSVRSMLKGPYRTVLGRWGFIILFDGKVHDSRPWDDIESVVYISAGGDAKISFKNRSSQFVESRIFGSDRLTRVFVAEAQRFIKSREMPDFEVLGDDSMVVDSNVESESDV